MSKKKWIPKVGELGQWPCGCIDKVTKIENDNLSLTLVKSCGRKRMHHQVLTKWECCVPDYVAYAKLIPKVKAVLYDR